MEIILSPGQKRFPMLNLPTITIPTVINQSPFFLMMSYKPHALLMVLPETQLPDVETHLQQLSAACDEALATHELARQVMASYTHQHFTSFFKGDKVWLEARNLKQHAINPKFTPKREGPFTVIKVLSPIVYQLCLPKTWKIHPMFYASLLSPYHKNDVHGLNFPAPPPDLIAGEEEYEIEKIIHHRGTMGCCSFLIQWKGYSAEEDSWIPEWDLKNSKATLANYKNSILLYFLPH